MLFELWRLWSGFAASGSLNVAQVLRRVDGVKDVPSLAANRPARAQSLLEHVVFRFMESALAACKILASVFPAALGRGAAH